MKLYRDRCWIQFILPVTILTIILLGEWTASVDAPDALRIIAMTVCDACREAKTQWAVFFAVIYYLVGFVILRRLWACSFQYNLTSFSTSPELIHNLTRSGSMIMDICFCGFLIFMLLHYILDYTSAATSTNVVIFIAGQAIGVGMSLWVLRGDMSIRNSSAKSGRPDENKAMETSWRSACILVIICTTICTYSLYHHTTKSRYAYMGHARWYGLWNNPNIYGLLMGAETVLAICLLARGMPNRDKSNSMIEKCYSKNVNYLFYVQSFVGIVVGINGLLHSYSRGAWLAVTVGAIYLLVCWSTQTMRRWLRVTNQCSFAIIVIAIMVLMFWRHQYPDSLIAKRVISVSNRNDLSWRNRVAAWEGALQIIVARPFFGLGWNQPETYYENYYSSRRLMETAAIEMNDYLMLGATLGIPALFCFGMYIWLTLLRTAECGVGSGLGGECRIQNAENGNVASEFVRLNWMKTTCHAGAIVFAVGFWCDGGLFRLPTASTFWILLELGAT